MTGISKHFSVEWQGTGTPGTLQAREPTVAELAAAAGRLAEFYNESHNSAMMANTQALSAAEVEVYYQDLWEAGGRPYLLEQDGVLLGDADLRNIQNHTAEFAILIGQRAAQGKGLGRRFALMLHALAFGALGLERLYVAIIPANLASQNLFIKLGYDIDDSPRARAYAEADDDVTMSLSGERFAALHGELVRDVRWLERP